MKKQILTSLILLIIINSCKKNNFSDKEYFIFGHFYGECVGNTCVDIYKLKDDALFEDTNNKNPQKTSGFYSGNYTQTSSQKYDIAKNLMQSFPAELLGENATTIGQPDAGDWGGFYLEYNFNGVRKFWLLDKMKTNVPAKYHTFIDTLNKTIYDLQ